MQIELEIEALMSNWNKILFDSMDILENSEGTNERGKEGKAKTRKWGQDIRRGMQIRSYTLIYIYIGLYPL